MKKPLLFCLAAILFFFSSKAQTNVSGNITTNTTWTKAGSPYILIGNVSVLSSYILTLEPGVTVERNTNLYHIVINGALQCKGLETDSIVFVALENQAFGSDYFLDFQKSDLTQSSLRYVSAHNNNGRNSLFRLGDEEELTQTDPKNSGVLTVSHSNLDHVFITTNGYKTTAGLVIDSSLISVGYFGQNQYSEGISFLNTQIYNSFIPSLVYYHSISYTNCYLYNVDMYQICCGANYTFINSTVENSKLGDQLGTSAFDSITILNSSFVNTPVYNDRVFLTAINSNFDYSDRVVRRDSAQSNIQLTASGGMVRDCRFQNTSLYSISGVIMSGLSPSPFADTVTHNRFYGLFNSIILNKTTSVQCDSNFFSSTVGYDINNIGAQNFSALYNYFQLTNGQTIDDLIYDKNDNSALGLVTYTPYATDSVLPVTLLSFRGTINGQVVQLNWQTNNETNTARYVIERKTGSAFTEIGTVPASGKTGAVSNYRFTDPLPATGTNNYRLKIIEIDADGKYAYSSVVPIVFTKAINSLLLYPNPAKDYVLADHAVVNNETQLQLVDATGNLVKMVPVTKGSMQTKISLAGLAKGTYRIVWQTGTKKESQLLFVQ